MVAEHALLAAQAVAEAEEAAKKASSLLDAANELEDLDHHTLDDKHGAHNYSFHQHVTSASLHEGRSTKLWRA